MSEIEQELLKLIADEYERAVSKHGPMCSAHEGYAVMLEEMDELWEEIKRQPRNAPKMVEEVIQVGAMALRFLADVCRGGKW